MRVSRNLKGPVRMRPVQVAVHIDHFGFYPDSEIETDIIDFFAKAVDAARKFIAVRLPVSKR